MKNLLITLSITILLVVSIFTGTVLANNNDLVRGVNSYSNLNEYQLSQLTKNTKLEGYEKEILNLEHQYQVNAFFILAVAKVETGIGKAGVGRSKNNLYGMKGSNGFRTYNNGLDSTKSFCELIYNNYFGNGYYSLIDISNKYCNTDWAYKVEATINELYYKLA